MEIVRNADGTLVVPAKVARQHEPEAGAESSANADADDLAKTGDASTRVLHPGEGGYDEALAEWDLQQNPDRKPVVSTASGRQEAMTLVHEVAISPDHPIAPAVP